MSASSVLRRNLLTTGIRFRPTTNITRFNNRFTTPISRSFTASAMGKEGVHNITSKTEWDSALKDGDKLLVVDCFATWCGPCKAIAPKVVEFSDKYTDVSFYKVDVDEQPEIAQELGVRAMPTFFLYKNGSKVADVVGANPVALEAAIKQHS